jgi:membrane protein DedA with SNARE-associated domain
VISNDVTLAHTASASQWLGKIDQKLVFLTRFLGTKENFHSLPNGTMGFVNFSALQRDLVCKD